MQQVRPKRIDSYLYKIVFYSLLHNKNITKLLQYIEEYMKNNNMKTITNIDNSYIENSSLITYNPKTNYGIKIKISKPKNLKKGRRLFIVCEDIVVFFSKSLLS